LSAGADELARAQNGEPNGGGINSYPNLDLVARVDRFTAEFDAFRDENRRFKRVSLDTS